ncbi:hypothetical protein L1887_43980 [Cichorium endivia]|nr:hypothetical protein L1887_43980 [Cichorium endivia]
MLNRDKRSPLAGRYFWTFRHRASGSSSYLSGQLYCCVLFAATGSATAQHPHCLLLHWAYAVGSRSVRKRLPARAVVGATEGGSTRQKQSLPKRAGKAVLRLDAPHSRPYRLHLLDACRHVYTSNRHTSPRFAVPLSLAPRPANLGSKRSLIFATAGLSALAASPALSHPPESGYRDEFRVGTGTCAGPWDRIGGHSGCGRGLGLADSMAREDARLGPVALRCCPDCPLTLNADRRQRWVARCVSIALGDFQKVTARLCACRAEQKQTPCPASEPSSCMQTLPHVTLKSLEYTVGSWPQHRCGR